MSKKQEEKTWYPNEELVQKIHETMLEKYGGWPGFERGMNVFQSIITEMKAARGIYRKAAILLRGVVTGRIFKDGNHRTAQALTETFLEMNNAPMYIQDSKEIIRFIKNILYYNIDEIEAWLKHGKTKGSDESVQRSP
jgi:prophage maintenance system killer protein